MLPRLEDFPIDQKTISEDRLNIEGKTRSNLLPWKGQFSPELVDVLLSTFAVEEQTVLDPFVGSGTVLIESARLGMSSIGVEINPAALKMAAIYGYVGIQPRERKLLLEGFRDALDSRLPPGFLTRRPKNFTESEIQESLLDLAKTIQEERIRVLLEALIVRLDFFSPGLNLDRVHTMAEHLHRTILGLPLFSGKVELIHCDARSIPKKANTANIVLTSPPYINVFNYHQQYRRSVEGLGWNLLRVAHSEIGSNRKFRGNRYLTVAQYCLDMARVLKELRRICNSDARLIFVVGRESNVRKTPFRNGDIVTKLALACAGLDLGLRQERVFKNRFGKLIYEDILHFIPSPSKSTDRTTPFEVARQVLITAIQDAPDESLDDLKFAIERVDEISESPLFCPATQPSTIATS